ncbi:MAG: ABC transporter ATP-binding protein [Verrucomicrobiota bacterium]
MSHPPPASSAVLAVRALQKRYPTRAGDLTVLRDVDFTVQRGEAVAIVGPSGSGKTTLLGLCAGLDTATEGSVELAGHAFERLDEDERAAVRNAHVGFIFQNFQLLPTLTAEENVRVPVELRGERGAGARARELLAAVGLGERADHYPIQLSGGEQQRVALARAFANRPDVLFADEPTGNLDGATSERVAAMLFDLNRREGTTLVLVTHDMELAGRCERILRISAGQVREEAADVSV